MGVSLKSFLLVLLVLCAVVALAVIIGVLIAIHNEDKGFVPYEYDDKKENNPEDLIDLEINAYSNDEEKE